MNKRKGGYASTFYHFNAKARPYAERSTRYNGIKYIEKKGNELYKKLQGW